MYSQGDAAEAFYVLLDGEIQLVKRMDGTDVVLSPPLSPARMPGPCGRSSAPRGTSPVAPSLSTVTRSRLFKLRAEDFAYLLKTWFPMAVHLLDGLFLGLTNADALIGAAGQADCPGRAFRRPGPRAQQPGRRRGARRRSAGGRLQEARRVLVKLAPKLTKASSWVLLHLLSEAIDRARTAPSLSTLEAGDLEDALAARLEKAGVENPWEVAPDIGCRPGSTRAGWTGSSNVRQAQRQRPCVGCRSGSISRAWSARSATRRDGSPSWSGR